MTDEKQSEGQVSSAESLADAGEIQPDQSVAGYPIHPEEGQDAGDKPQEGMSGPDASSRDEDDKLTPGE